MGKRVVGLREKEGFLERKHEQTNKSDHKEDLVPETIQSNP